MQKKPHKRKTSIIIIHRPLRVVELNGKETHYETCQEAAEALGVRPSTISQAARRKSLVQRRYWVNYTTPGPVRSTVKRTRRKGKRT